MKEKQLKNQIKKYYFGQLKKKFNITKITFRKSKDMVKMHFKGGIDGKGKCRLQVEYLEQLHPALVDPWDNILRILSISQYFLRYNMTYHIKQKIPMDIGVRLINFNKDKLHFQGFEIYVLFGNGTYTRTEFNYDPLKYLDNIENIVEKVKNNNKFITTMEGVQ